LIQSIQINSIQFGRQGWVHLASLMLTGHTIFFSEFFVLGIGLAQACAYYGLSFICAVGQILMLGTRTPQAIHHQSLSLATRRHVANGS
jgi:hypothetical protein